MFGPPEPIVPVLAPPVLPASPYNPYGGPMQVMFDEQSDDEVSRRSTQSQVIN
jgi:hypothetical protein